MHSDDPIFAASAQLTRDLRKALPLDSFTVIPTPENKLKVFVLSSAYEDACLEAPNVFYGYNVQIKVVRT